MRILLASCALVAFVTLGSAQSYASIEMVFDQGAAENGGSISYDGAGGALVGTDIVFTKVAALGSPLNNGVELFIQNGRLNFTTGANITEGPSDWTFAAGGSFTLTGTVWTSPAMVTQVATGTLLTGYFGAIVDADLTLGQMRVDGVGFDTKNRELLAYYGITIDDFIFANTEIDSNASYNATTRAFNNNVTNADITNTAVPEPATVLVWLGLAALVPASLLLKRKS